MDLIFVKYQLSLEVDLFETNTQMLVQYQTGTVQNATFMAAHIIGIASFSNLDSLDFRN